MTPTERAHLYKLIDEACTNRQVRGLLRKRKEDDKELRLSGAAPDLTRNLQEGHARGTITEDDLVTLLAAGEENGRQHIFLFRPTVQSQSRYKDMETLRALVIRETGVDERRLPHFVLQPSNRTLSDVRLDKLANDKFNLVVKWYSGRRYERVIRSETYRKNGDEFIRRDIKIETTRLVSFARFHPRGLLEIRVPTGERESRKTVLDELHAIRSIISPVFDSAHFLEVNLEKAMQWLVENNGKRARKHRVSTAQAADGEARAEFNPAMEGEDLFSSHRHREALKEYEDFARMDVYWTSPLGKVDQEEEIRCQMAMFKPNGIRIGAKRAAEEIDFVVNRLWELRDGG